MRFQIRDKGKHGSKARKTPKPDLRHLHRQSLLFGSSKPLIDSLNKNRGKTGRSEKARYKKAVWILRELQAMHAAWVRESKIAEPFREQRDGVLMRGLARIPLWFSPWVDRQTRQKRKPKKNSGPAPVVEEATPRVSWGWSSKHPVGESVGLMAYAWQAGAIEHVRQCRTCGKWWFDRPNSLTCSDACRQRKSRKEREK